MDQRMTQSVLLFGPDFCVLVTTVETDITLLHYIFFKHSWVWVGGGVPDFFFSAPMRFPLSFFPRLLEICSGVLLCCEHDLHIHLRLVSIMFSQHPEMAKVVACLLYSRTEKLWTQQQCANPILFLLVMLWLKEKTNKQTKNWAFVSARWLWLADTWLLLQHDNDIFPASPCGEAEEEQDLFSFCYSSFFFSLYNICEMWHGVGGWLGNYLLTKKSS